MNLQPLIVDSINRSVLNVFSTMLGVELGSGEASVERSMPDANDGVVSFIGVAGSWAGTGSVSCSPALACRVCSLMLMTESTSVDEDVLDAVAEWIVTRFPWEGEILLVKLCLAPHEKSAHLLPHMGNHVCALDV